METGVINEENLSGLLRNLSQRRRNGVLEITYPDYVMSLHFNKGKVVDASLSTIAPCAEIVALLKAAEFLPANAEPQAQNYSELFRELNNFTVVDEDFFRRVVRHFVLEKLYSLDLTKGAYYSFRVQMVEGDKSFSPAVSAGQLLLDFVALQTDADRFKATFDGGQTISRGDVPGALSEEEKAIYEALLVPRSLGQLRARALLSRFHFQDALLSMFERGAVVIGDTAPDKQLDQNLKSDSMSDRLDDLVSNVAAVAEAELESDSEDAVASEGGYATRGPSIRVRMIARSTTLLQSSWMPNLVMIIFMAAAFSIPFYVWPRMMVGF